MNRLSWLRSAPYAVPAAIYAVVAVASWPHPVIGLLHVESSAVVAGVGFFTGGLAALVLFGRGEALGDVLLRQAALLAVPLVLLTATLIWRPNCGYALGLLLFIVFTVPSVGLGVSLAYALDALGIRRSRLVFVITGVLVATVPIAYDLGLHPQLYSYNHVWGGVLGPLYDEELAIRPGLFFFRALTLWWAVALVLVSERALHRRGGAWKEESRRSGLALLAAGLMIAGTYGAAPWLGINSPSWYVQARLGGHLELERFDIYFDPESVSEGELRVIADVHRYRFARLSDELGVEPRHRIATYLYPDHATKASLTGSRTTSVAPTWLPVPQMHLLLDRFEGSFAHELVHVFAREFGMPVLRASPAVGLVEGLAVALDAPNGLPSVHAQVAAGMERRERLGLERALAAEGIADQLGPFGFWTGRGAVSYTMMGSFVRYLLDEYGIEPLRAAYRTGAVERAYGKPVDELAREWVAFIREYPVDPEAGALVAARFARPSLFEQRCPHHVPRVERLVRAGNEAMRRGDASEAGRAFTAAVRADGSNQSALVGWAAMMLAEGHIDEVVERLQAFVPHAGAALLTRLGDAYRLRGDDAAADEAYAMALERLPPYSHEQRALLEHRATLPPQSIRALLTVLPPDERARMLEDAPGTSADAALIRAELGEFEHAAELMAAAEEAVPTAQRLAWASAFLHAAGRRAQAAMTAEEAAAAYQARDRPAAAERLRDRAALIWHAVMHDFGATDAPSDD